MQAESAGLKKKRNIRKYVFRFLCAILVGVLLLVLWQLREYSKLRSILLPPGIEYQVPENLPEFVRAAVRENRSHYLKQPEQEDLDAYRESVLIKGYEKEEDDRLAQKIIEIRQMSHEQPEYISVADAKADLDYLHAYLKYASAHYQYYGGERVFGLAFEEIKEKVGRENISQEVSGHEAEGLTNISVERFTEIIQEDILWIVRDLHSHIAGSNFEDIYPDYKYYNYYTEAISFTETLQTEYMGNQYTLKAINGVSPWEYLRLTILENGSFVYVPWDYTNEHSSDYSSGSAVCTLLLEDELGSRTEMDFELNRTTQLHREMTEVSETTGERISRTEVIPYALEEREDYFYMINSTLQPAYEKAFKEMEKEAVRLRGGKPIVIDIREHGGGWDLYGFYWIMRYLDISKVQLLAMPIPTYNFAVKTQAALTSQQGKYVKEAKNPNLTETYKGSGNGVHIANKTPIFVLTDRNCGSSGEWFLTYLRRMDNVVIVGEQTYGLFIGGNTATSWLPRSRIKITFSLGLGTDSDLRDLEGYGYAPDVYVPSTIAADRVEAMMSFYGI